MCFRFNPFQAASFTMTSSVSRLQRLTDRMSPKRDGDDAPVTSAPEPQVHAERVAHFPAVSGQKPKDKIGGYLRDHDAPHAAGRRSAVTDKLLIAVAGVSLAINVVQAVAIMQLIPLYRVVPFFVTWSDKSDQVVRVEPPTGNLKSLAILEEANVREYVTMRNTITDDPQRTIYQWGTIVRLMSSKPVYDQFLAETKPVYDALKERRFTRSVSLKSVLKIQNGYWQVEFDVIDRRIGSGLTDGGDERRTFVAQLRAQNVEQSISYDNRFLNPLGFTVTAYTVASKKD
jgi:type IV secretory pathway component VirB8